MPILCNNRNNVDLVIFTCVNFREFLILELFTKFKIREYTFFIRSVILIIIFARFLNSQKLKPREYYKIYTNRANSV